MKLVLPLRRHWRFLALCAMVVAIARSMAVAVEPSPVARQFPKAVVGFLDQHCVTCHGPREPKGEVSLAAFRDEASVIKARRIWDIVLRKVEAGEMPPEEKPQPTAAEVESFLTTVRAARDHADQFARPDPGQVTARRLNRIEYNNTIRDLVGVDFDPAEDFPADDVGHGFDNIGDVLSLSPVLMERYLAAAESITQRAILVDPPKPPVRRQSARYLEPAQSNDVKTRTIDDKKSLHTPWRLTLGGDYIFRVRAHGIPADGQPPRMSLSANGMELAQHDVMAVEGKPELYEARVTLPVGEVRWSAAMLNASDGETKRSLVVHHFELEGPLDTRPAAQRRILAVRADQSHAEQTREVLGRFATRAYRRPATADEVERLAKLVEATEARGEKWEAGIQLALQAILVSPKFLFRIELDDRPDADDSHPIDEFQLASRLSYFLWSTMPDDELLELAGKSQLTANLEAQVRRMLVDPKSRSLVDNFALQWLQLRRLKTVAPDAKLFPSFNEPLRSAMLIETEMFFETVIREDRSILDLIDADFTFLNESLARLYGIVDTNGTKAGQPPTTPGGRPFRGPRFQRVSLTGPERGGLLTQASILTVTSNPTRTSPVKRGRWVLEQLLGTPPPPPPPNVPELPQDEKAVLSGSLRQRMEQHRARPSCANCHNAMDPLGFAFENYDAIGAFRTKDGEFPIDPSGTLPDGQTFQGPGDLKSILKEKKELFARNLAEKMLTYALGRGLEYFDKRPVDRVVTALDQDGYKFSRLVIEVARSEPFRLRRGKSDQEGG